VSTEMTQALARRAGVRVEDDLLVGFKWIGKRVDDAGPQGFLFAFEESHGYVKGTHARDKDAAVAALLFAELAATVKYRKQTVLEYLDDLFIEVGHYGERLINIFLEGREGLARINQLMAALRSQPPRVLGGLTLTEVCDYRTHEVRTLKGDRPPRPLPHPSGDLLIFHTEHPGTRIAARPSGTEPKIKFYLFARTDVADREDLRAAKAETSRRLDQLATDLNAYVDDVLKTTT
jgi:phosphoglucomutase